jgi:hypothetical protein
MNIAICFTGFLRSLSNIENIKHIYSIFPVGLQSVTIYYSCPNKIEENDTEPFDINHVLGLFNQHENDKMKINIQFREYDRNEFVEKAKQLNLPYITSTKYHSHRILSCLNGFSETAKLINAKDNYNFIIFTRLDIIPHVCSVNDVFDNKQILKDEAYIWRTIPYISAGDLAYHAEDRVFLCSCECVDIIKTLYDNLFKLNLSEDIFCTEKILGVVFNLNEHIKKYHLTNLVVYSTFNTYTQSRINIKYTKEFLDSM